MPFDEKSTEEKTFYLANGKEILVPTMEKFASFKAVDVPQLKAKAIELPYEGQQMAMYVVLPEKNTPEILHWLTNNILKVT